MKLCTWFAALLALSSWSFAFTGQALAHGGTTFAVLDCEEEEGDEARTFDCEDEEGEEARAFDCEDEEGDEARAFDCEDEEGDEAAAVLDCHDDEDSE